MATQIWWCCLYYWGWCSPNSGSKWICKRRDQASDLPLLCVPVADVDNPGSYGLAGWKASIWLSGSYWLQWSQGSWCRSTEFVTFHANLTASLGYLVVFVVNCFMQWYLQVFSGCLLQDCDKTGVTLYYLPRPTPNCNNVLLIKSFGFWYIFLSSRKQYSHQWCSFGLVVLPDLFFLLLLQAKVNVGVLLIKTWRDIGCIGEWSLSTMSCTKQFFSSCILASNQFSALKGDV